MRHLRWLSSGLGAAVVLCALFASPVAATASHKPDGWIRYEGFHNYDGTNTPNPGPWKGKNIYNTTGANQTATTDGGFAHFDGEYFYFTITIQNDGVTDRFKIKGGGESHTKYFKGSSNITSKVNAGTYQTASLGAGASTTITVRIDASWQATRLVTLTSVGDSTKRDAVKAGFKGGGCGC